MCFYYFFLLFFYYFLIFILYLLTTIVLHGIISLLILCNRASCAIAHPVQLIAQVTYIRKNSKMIRTLEQLLRLGPRTPEEEQTIRAHITATAAEIRAKRLEEVRLHGDSKRDRTRTIPKILEHIYSAYFETSNRGRRAGHTPNDLLF